MTVHKPRWRTLAEQRQSRIDILTRLLRECIPIIEDERTQLIESYTAPPKEGGERDIETIEERLPYDTVIELGDLLNRAKAAIK